MFCRLGTGMNLGPWVLKGPMCNASSFLLFLLVLVLATFKIILGFRGPRSSPEEYNPYCRQKIPRELKCMRASIRMDKILPVQIFLSSGCLVYSRLASLTMPYTGYSGSKHGCGPEYCNTLLRVLLYTDILMWCVFRFVVSSGSPKFQRP